MRGFLLYFALDNAPARVYTPFKAMSNPTVQSTESRTAFKPLPTSRLRVLDDPDRKRRLAVVVALKAEGKSLSEIAATVGLAKRTVWSYLAALSPKSQQLAAFQRDRASYLDNVQALALNVQVAVFHSLLESLENNKLSEWQRIELLKAAGMVGDYAYKHARLERGESTDNIAQVTRILDTVHGRRAATAQVIPPVTPAISTTCDPDV